MSDRAETILHFWFGEPGANLHAVSGRWFTKNPEFDREIATLFGSDIERAALGELDKWGSENADRALALVVLLDQFSRNVFRDSPRMFGQDERALRVCLHGQARGFDRTLSFIERYMFCMPMMHAEDRDVQRRSVAAFAAIASDAKAGCAPAEVQKLLQGAHDYAQRHARIIERFGRFPHRNALLGRESTPEEKAFLEEPGSSF
jgi:uncharacterized protein (DUF924 family)